MARGRHVEEKEEKRVHEGDRFEMVGHRVENVSDDAQVFGNDGDDAQTVRVVHEV